MPVDSTAPKESAAKVAPTPQGHPIDPIQLTRELVAIDSTTYLEGKAGDFLEEFLLKRGWSVEKTAVPQAEESGHLGERWNIYAGPAIGSPDLVFSTHIDTVPP